MDPCNITLAGKKLGKSSYFRISSSSHILNSRDFFIAFIIIILSLRILF